MIWIRFSSLDQVKSVAHTAALLYNIRFSHSHAILLFRPILIYLSSLSEVLLNICLSRL